MARLSSHVPSRCVSDFSSSPDPLAEISMAENSTPCRRRRSASAVSERYTTTTQDSPMKMVTEHSASPWRIKVTVEAEPENREAGAHRVERVTRTTKVPLREESAASNARSNSTQRRKSARKSASPSRVTRSRRQSVTDLDIVVLGDNGEDDAWVQKPRLPRKRAGSKSQPVKKGRKSGSDAHFEIREDNDSTKTQEHKVDEHLQEKSPEMRELDLNKMHTRTRSDSFKKNMDRGQPVRNISFNSAVSYPTPSPTASEHDFDTQAQDPQPIGLDTVMESEGFTMIDLDTLPSVRQMRNTPEYPVIPENTTQEVNVSQGAANDESSSGIEAPSIAVTNEESGISDISSSPPGIKNGPRAKPYSIGHLQLPSSTNVQRHRLVTPMPVVANPLSSPQLPSPPRAPVPATVERSPVHSDQVVQAGAVLQDTVTPEHSMFEDHKPDQRQQGDDKTLFGGFSDSMRRELRAELRFGEELSKKQKQKDVKGKPSRQPSAAGLHFVPEQQQQQQQVWRGETTVQRTPVITNHAKNEIAIPEDAPTQTELPNKTWETNHLRLEEEQQVEREAVIAQAQQNAVIEIEDDSPEPASDQENGNETFGDIWLAEARNASSSPKVAEEEDATPKSLDLPKRKLIPSPWKRGQQIDTSQLSLGDSFSGMMWKQPMTKTRNARFGDALVANPDVATRKVSDSSRRRSGMYDAEHMIIKTPRRISERIESDNSDDDQDIEDENFDAARRLLKWRSAADVIDEETKELEDENEVELSDKESLHEDIAATRLHETNLDHVPEQDLSSPQPTLSQDKYQLDELDHDSTYASRSSEDTLELYRQRTSLSPSKERPNTPKSAMKGTRASFGMALNFGADSDEANSKKVVWAKRSKCVNDLWEESTQSIRSTQTKGEETSQSPQPLKQGLNLEPSFEVNPQPIVQQEVNKGWFGWFQKDEQAAQDAPISNSASQSKQYKSNSLDGSIDHFITQDEDDQSDSSFEPTSRQAMMEPDTIVLRSHNEAPDAQAKKDQGKLSNKTSARKITRQSHPPKTPSYLLPPSYPSDPHRDPSVPLSTSGPFTTTHFRTLHIIHAKSSRPRFHGPAFPDEIRPEIIDLVGDWTMEIDERETMGEDGDFVFGIGPSQARVLERFMREVEEGYAAAGAQIEWAWTAEDLAEKLGRIAVGERVRDEEKASRTIMRSARKAKAARPVF